MEKSEEMELTISDVTVVDVYINGEHEFDYSTTDPSEIEVRVKDEKQFHDGDNT